VKVHHGLPDERLPAAALTIGSFDGLHLGHQAVIGALDGGPRRVVMTFEPHPRCVLDPDSCPKSITSLDEKLRLLERLGVDDAIVLLFTKELAGRSAAEFMASVLAAVDLRRLVVGPDFALGHGRQGDVAWLRQHGAEHGYELVVAEPLSVRGQEVHSSEIRKLVTVGDVAGAARLLGRDFSLLGIVEHGHRVGRELGFPTLNLSLAPNKLVPGPGVYAGRARVGDDSWAAAIGVGYRPTFGGTDLTVEAYLLDFEGDLYQRRVEVSFAARLRDEVKFANAAELAHQMAADVEATRRLLNG
jgi:riboflavin kinase/FMN adenylyltransferase